MAGNPLSPELEPPADGPGPVTATVTRRVKPGHEAAYEQFLAGIGGAARAQPYAYVTNYNTGALSVIDTATDTVVDRVPDVGNGHIVLHPDGTTAFITDRGSNTIAVMDVATRQVVDRLPVGAFPWALAVTPEGDRAYVVRLNVPQSLVFLEVAERRVMTSAFYAYFDRIALGPGRRGYATLNGGATLMVFDVDADALIDLLQADELGASDFFVFSAIALTADGEYLWAADTYFGTLVAIHLRTRYAGGSVRFAMGSSRELVLNSVGNRLYMTEGNNIVVYDTPTHAVTRVPLGDEGGRVALTPDDARAFITLSLGNIAVLDTASLSIVDLFPVEPGISAIAIAP